MSKQKKASSISSSRTFKVISQSLSVTDINFKKRTLSGSTELTVLPLTSSGKLWKIPLNCKQCRILRVTIESQYSAKYTYFDPLLAVTPVETKKRNLEYYDACHSERLKSCDPDSGPTAGELTIKVPKEVYSQASHRDYKPLKVQVEFSLEQPMGGVSFVIPPGTSKQSIDHAHVYSYGWENSSRLWFPCVDTYTELCSWRLRFVVPATMVAVSCGELTEQLLTADGRKKVFSFTQPVPTAAPCIGFAVGSFEVYPDPVLQEVTHFCLPGLLQLLKHTVQFVHEVFGLYEELLSSRFPFTNYKMVFLDHTYQEVASYSTLSLLSVNLLHSARIIDQVLPTRRAISHAIACQYFGCFLLPLSWGDWWLPVGVAHFLSGLYCRKAFGSTEYQYWVLTQQEKVVKYETENYLPPLCSSLAASPSGSTGASSHPNLTADRKLSVLTSKAHLVIRMIQLKVGNELFLQVFNKLLSLASSAAASTEPSLWPNLLVSTSAFVKLILTVSGKDMTSFMEQWVCRNGVPRFHASFNYIRKKNFIELRFKQDNHKGQPSFVGPMTVVVQEFDGSFTHTIQVEETTTSHELPCHSKIRKAKKRKVPLAHGEEVDIDVSSLDSEVPVLWVKIDPEFQWLRSIFMEQSETVWQCVLRYERDGCSQLEALRALEAFPNTHTRDLFRESILNTQFYYRVRIQAAESLAKRLYGSNSHLSIVKYNDFSDVTAYLIQKALPLFIAGMRTVHKQCPREVTAFIMDLFKYSDNHSNKFSDGHYTSALIDALCATITPKVAMAIPPGVDFEKSPTLALNKETQYILTEIVQRLNIEKVLPSYHHTVTVSCLRCLRELQKSGHLPTDSSFFREHTSSNCFITVREAAVTALVDIVHSEGSEGDLEFLLGLLDSGEPRVQLLVMRELALNPPFTRRQESQLNTLGLVERLWSMLGTKFYYDARLRNGLVDLYSSLYGRLTPTCVPEGLGVVIDLKERVARSSLASPLISPRLAAAADDPPTKTTSSSGVLSASSGPLSPATVQPGISRVSPVEHPQVLALRAGQQQSLSLKISTSQLKGPLLVVPSHAPRSRTGSPESAISPGGESDDSAVSPYQPKAKRHKGEHKQKHKHKKKKSKKSKHKHKHGSKDFVDVESID